MGILGRSEARTSVGLRRHTYAQNVVFVKGERAARDTFVLSSSSTIPLSPLDGPRNLRSASISPTRHSQSKFQSNFDDEPRGRTAISPLQVSPPTRRELAPGHAPVIFDREAQCPPVHQLCRPKYTFHFRVAKPTLNSITRTPTSSLRWSTDYNL